MTDKEESSSVKTLLAAGGIIGALAASSCCIVPLALFGFGVSGAWIGNLTRLAPYQPYFILVAIICIGTGGWLVHRTSVRACAADQACARPLSGRWVKASLVAATLLILAAIGFDLFAPLILS